MANFIDNLTTDASTIKFKLVDPLGRPIVGLKYQVRQLGKIVAEGSTDSNGDSQQFQGIIGFSITIAVERFLTGQMKVIKEVTPWQQVFPIILVSGKVLEQTTLVEDKGEPGDYERKTYIVQDGDTLDSVAQQKGVQAQELAELNQLAADAPLSAGQLLKVPLPTPSQGSGSVADNAQANSAESPPAGTDTGTGASTGQPQPTTAAAGATFFASPDESNNSESSPNTTGPTPAPAEAESTQSDKYNAPAPPENPGYAPAGPAAAASAASTATSSPTPTPPAPTPRPPVPHPAPAPAHAAATAPAHAISTPAPARAAHPPSAAANAAAASTSSAHASTPSAAAPPSPSTFQIIMSDIKSLWTSVWEGDRGSNGSPKSVGNLVCPQACVTLGSKGPLVEELNIRLIGFGGTLQPQPTTTPRNSPAPVSAPMDEFTVYTENAVKQFQRDYMKIASPSGKVCGSVLAALDDFRNRYEINFSATKCKCSGHCHGYGNGLTDSSSVGILDHRRPIAGLEYPGMHRCIYWALRAARFYLEDLDKDLGFKFKDISSGYRCWKRNQQEGFKTSNHMGQALDIRFQPTNGGTRTDWITTEKIAKRYLLGA